MITIIIETDNAAFQDDYDHELSNLLHSLGDRAFMSNLYDEMPVKDSNGNTCGIVQIKGKDE